MEVENEAEKGPSYSAEESGFFLFGCAACRILVP